MKHLPLSVALAADGIALCYFAAYDYWINLAVAWVLFIILAFVGVVSTWGTEQK